MSRATKRAQVVVLLGSKCAVCGNGDLRVLQINHKYNDGHALKRGGRIRGFDVSHFRKIISGEDPIDRYELLCGNCYILRTGGWI